MTDGTEFIDVAASRLPVVFQSHARTVREGFWKKLLRHAAHIPFAEDLAAAYFCVIDPETPAHVRGLVLAVLAYFVLQFDFVRAAARFFGLVGDAAVLAVALRAIAEHIKPAHRVKAREALSIPENFHWRRA